MPSVPAPLVSVITPVYNGAEYLHECIESVRAQSYNNWRYTVVNNCSTDDTLKIAQDFARLDPRIRVLSNTAFLPLIANHNHALTLIGADAAYVKPLMADDWLYRECLEQLVTAAVAKPAAGLICCSARSAAERILFDALPPTDAPVSYRPGREAARIGLLENGYFFGSPTTMLIRADLVRSRSPFYNPHNLQADEEACYELLRESDFAFVHQPLAYVRMHARSHTSATFHLFSLASCHVYALARYGPDYLTPSELGHRLDERMREYYARLALGAVERRGAQFWDFHRRMLAMIGRPLSRLRLARGCRPRVQAIGFPALARPWGQGTRLGRLASLTAAAPPQ